MEVKVTKVSLRSTKPNSFARSSSFRYHLKIQVVHSTEFSVSCGAFKGISHQNTKYCPFYMAIMYTKWALALHHITFGKLFSQTCPKHPKADKITQTCCRPSFMTPSVEEFQMTMSTARFVFFKPVQNNPGFRQICVFLQFFFLGKILKNNIFPVG